MPNRSNTTTVIDVDARAAMLAFDAAAHATLDPALVELVRLRASQLNGCRYCTDLHAAAARAAGERDGRLAGLARWRDEACYSEPERAALALTEAVTLIAGTGVPDAVLDDASRTFTPTELAHLLWTIAAINVWNRVAIATRMADRPG